jgi:hypothetical protein
MNTPTEYYSWLQSLSDIELVAEKLKQNDSDDVSQSWKDGWCDLVISDRFMDRVFKENNIVPVITPM